MEALDASAHVGDQARAPWTIRWVQTACSPEQAPGTAAASDTPAAVVIDAVDRPGGGLVEMIRAAGARAGAPVVLRLHGAWSAAPEVDGTEGILQSAIEAADLVVVSGRSHLVRLAGRVRLDPTRVLMSGFPVPVACKPWSALGVPSGVVGVLVAGDPSAPAFEHAVDAAKGLGVSVEVLDVDADSEEHMRRLRSAAVVAVPAEAPWGDALPVAFARALGRRVVTNAGAVVREPGADPAVALLSSDATQQDWSMALKDALAEPSPESLECAHGRAHVHAIRERLETLGVSGASEAA